MRAFLCAMFLLIGCNKDAKTTEPTGASKSEAVTLVRLENGDAACYVVVQSSQGEVSLPGAFELCAGGSQDATALIGKKVTYKTQKSKVLAAECQGNPDCGKSDEVDLVTNLTAE